MDDRPRTDTNDEALLTLQQTAARMQVSRRCVQKFVSRGLIPAIRVSRRCTRFHWPSVLAALRQLEVSGNRKE